MSTATCRIRSSILSSALCPFCCALSGTFEPPWGSRQHNLYTPAVNLISALLVAVLAVSSGATTGGGAGAAPGAGHPDAGAANLPLPAALARLDDLHRRRDDKGAWNEEQRLVQALLARAPNDYDVLWRAARFYFWASDDPGVPRE